MSITEGASGRHDRTKPRVPFAMRETVEREIATAIAEGSTRCKFFNNFPDRLRITGRPSLNDDHFLATLADPKLTHADYPGASTKGYSARYLADTPLSFIAAVDRAMAEVGVDGTIVEELDVDARKIGTYVVLLEYVFPVYLRLREMGYGHTELVK
jgi:hypothetical protein